VEVLVCLLQLGCCDPDLPVCRDVLTSFVQNLGEARCGQGGEVEDREVDLPIDISCCKKKYLKSVPATHLPRIFVGL